MLQRATALHFYACSASPQPSAPVRHTDSGSSDFRIVTVAHQPDHFRRKVSPLGDCVGHAGPRTAYILGAPCRGPSIGKIQAGKLAVQKQCRSIIGQRRVGNGVVRAKLIEDAIRTNRGDEPVAAAVYALEQVAPRLSVLVLEILSMRADPQVATGVVPGVAVDVIYDKAGGRLYDVMDEEDDLSAFAHTRSARGAFGPVAIVGVPTIASENSVVLVVNDGLKAKGCWNDARHAARSTGTSAGAGAQSASLRDRLHASQASGDTSPSVADAIRSCASRLGCLSPRVQ
jgi:hypothetical protein